MTTAPPTVLIVDDDVALRSAFARVLERVGHHVVQASGGPEVGELIRSHRPSLVLLDNHMPGTSGVELIRLIRADWRSDELPIVLISGSSVQGEIDEAMRAGANDFRRKPVELPDLIATVDAALRPPTPAPPREVLT